MTSRAIASRVRLHVPGELPGWGMPKKRKAMNLEPDAWLTQYGEHPPGQPCRSHLRTELGETDMSMIMGRIGAEEASMIVRKWASPLAAVRYVQVGTLREKGFVVEHTPTRHNSGHVSVYAPRGVDDEQMEWDDGVAALFEACFKASSDEGGRAVD